MSQGKRKTRIPIRSKKDWQEIFLVTLNQRRRGPDGERLAGFSLEEIAAMTPAERQRVKEAGWLGKKRSPVYVNFPVQG